MLNASSIAFFQLPSAGYSRVEIVIVIVIFNDNDNDINVHGCDSDRDDINECDHDSDSESFDLNYLWAHNEEFLRTNWLWVIYFLYHHCHYQCH